MFFLPFLLSNVAAVPPPGGRDGHLLERVDRWIPDGSDVSSATRGRGQDAEALQLQAKWRRRRCSWWDLQCRHSALFIAITEQSLYAIKLFLLDFLPHYSSHEALLNGSHSCLDRKTFVSSHVVGFFHVLCRWSSQLHPCSGSSWFVLEQRRWGRWCARPAGEPSPITEGAPPGGLSAHCGRCYSAG